MLAQASGAPGACWCHPDRGPAPRGFLVRPGAAARAVSAVTASEAWPQVLHAAKTLFVRPELHPRRGDAVFPSQSILQRVYADLNPVARPHWTPGSFD